MPHRNLYIAFSGNGFTSLYSALDETLISITCLYKKVDMKTPIAIAWIYFC